MKHEQAKEIALLIDDLMHRKFRLFMAASGSNDMGRIQEEIAQIHHDLVQALEQIETVEKHR